MTKYLRCFPAISQRNFSPGELILMLDFVLERKEGRGRPAAELSAQLKALPSNADVVHETGFRSVTGLGTSLGHMTEIDAGRGDWPAGHEYSNRPTLRPHFKAVRRQFGTEHAARRARVAAIISAPSAANEVEEPDIDDGFIEGRTFFALHRRHC